MRGEEVRIFLCVSSFFQGLLLWHVGLVSTPIVQYCGHSAWCPQLGRMWCPQLDAFHFTWEDPPVYFIKFFLSILYGAVSSPVHEICYFCLVWLQMPDTLGSIFPPGASVCFDGFLWFSPFACLSFCLRRTGFPFCRYGANVIFLLEDHFSEIFPLVNSFLIFQ